MDFVYFLVMTPVTAAPSRRAVARGALWSVPTLTAITAAPALAASVCPSLGGNWAISNVSNMNSTGGVTDTPSAGAVTLIPDAGTTAKGTVTYSKSLAVRKGVAYSFSFDLQTRDGRGAFGAQGYATSVVISIGLASGSNPTTLVNLTSRTTNPDGSTNGGTEVKPASGTDFGANGTVGAHQTATASFTPDTDGTAIFSYAFTLAQPAALYSNDDWIIIPTLTCI